MHASAGTTQLVHDPALVPEYRPALHIVQLLEPAAANRPPAQAPVQVATERPVDAPYKPGAQLMQALLLLALEYLPEPHATHVSGEDAPAVIEYVPAGQLAQVASIVE